MVEDFVAKLTLISQKSFDIFSAEYSDVINALDQAIAAEAAYNTSVGKNQQTGQNFKTHLVKTFCGCGFQFRQLRP